MTEKTQIIRELGIRELLLPKLISDALDANNRVKYFFALLQMAKQHADNPQLELSNLRNEREEFGIQDTSFDRVVECSIKKQDRENFLATQVLETLAKSGLPTRAEITDAARGQRAECVMLNKGKYIVEAVKILSILLQTEERHNIKKRQIFKEFTWQYGIFDIDNRIINNC